jgi:hypothetical protein
MGGAACVVRSLALCIRRGFYAKRLTLGGRRPHQRASDRFGHRYMQISDVNDNAMRLCQCSPDRDLPDAASNPQLVAFRTKAISP